MRTPPATQPPVSYQRPESAVVILLSTGSIAGLMEVGSADGRVAEVQLAAMRSGSPPSNLGLADTLVEVPAPTSGRAGAAGMLSSRCVFRVVATGFSDGKAV